MAIIFCVAASPPRSRFDKATLMLRSLHPLSTLRSHGAALRRPECVLTHRSGRLFASDWTGRGGVSVIEPDGETWRIEARGLDFDLRPNGVSLTQEGDFLAAHLGPDQGGVYRLAPDGAARPFLLAIDGAPLPPTNFIYSAIDGGHWISVSTRQSPRALGYRASVADGFIIRVDRRGARIVADDLGYANECVPSPDGSLLYVNETFSRRLTVFDIQPDGSLTGRRLLTEFGAGVFPDGLAFDEAGDAWVTSIVSNRVIRVTPKGRQTMMLEDADPEHLDWVERAYQNETMGRPHLDGVVSKTLRNISNLAFGGEDLKTAYLGCLLGQEIRSFRVSTAGHPGPSWRADLTALPAARAAARSRLEPS